MPSTFQQYHSFLGTVSHQYDNDILYTIIIIVQHIHVHFINCNPYHIRTQKCKLTYIIQVCISLFYTVSTQTMSGKFISSIFLLSNIHSTLLDTDSGKQYYNYNQSFIITHINQILRQVNNIPPTGSDVIIHIPTRFLGHTALMLQYFVFIMKLQL